MKFINSIIAAIAVLNENLTSKSFSTFLRVACDFLRRFSSSLEKLLLIS